MLKRWYPVTYMLILAGLIMTPGIVNAESAQDFRQQNGLQVYDPPVWFVEGYFIASEKNPGYVFGPVQDFVRTLKGTTTWLIEDLELKRLIGESTIGTQPRDMAEAAARTASVAGSPAIPLPASTFF